MIAFFFSGRIKGANIELLENIQKKYNCIYFMALNTDELDDEIKILCSRLNIGEYQLFYKKIIPPSYIYKHLHWEQWEEPNKCNTWSMFYNNFLAFRLIELYEKKYNVEFETIVKYRSDIHAEIINIHDIIADWTIYVPDGNDYNGLCDLIAYGNKRTMKEYCDVCNNIDEMCKKGIKMHPETLLGAHISEKNINKERFLYEVILDGRRGQKCSSDIENNNMYKNMEEDALNLLYNNYVNEVNNWFESKS